MVWRWESQVARTGSGEAGAEGGAEPKLDTGDMAGDNDVEGTGEILTKKSILSSRDREQSMAQMHSDVGSMPKLCACSKAHTVWSKAGGP